MRIPVRLILRILANFTHVARSRYESARLVHGRPYPLQGRSYTNLFVHFKPAEKWEAQLLGDPRWQRLWS